MFKKIGLHKMVYCNTPAIISTVQINPCKYETMVMFEDGEEIESYITYTEAEAKAKHNEVVNSWNDTLYNGSIAKYLGAANVGQFVKAMVAC